MDLARLDQILAQFDRKQVLVVGDFFLDRYLVIEESLAERSLETGLDAHQVIEVRNSPGAAGTVTNNLAAMGAGVVAVGVAGDDGEGFELLRGLDATGVDLDQFVIRGDRRTPTYTKPMLRGGDGTLRELNRLEPETPLMMEHLPSREEYRAAARYIRQVAGEEKVRLE